MSASTRSRSETIGVSMQSFDNNFQILLRQGLDARASEVDGVTLQIEDAQADISRQINQRLPEVVEYHLMAGECDFLLRIVARNLADYRRVQIEHLTRIKDVQSVKTDIPMQMIKLST